jgi:hypothetical protein
MPLLHAQATEYHHNVAGTSPLRRHSTAAPVIMIVTGP